MTPDRALSRQTLPPTGHFLDLTYSRLDIFPSEQLADLL